MKTYLLSLLLLTHEAFPFVPAVGRKARTALLTTRRDEIAHEIQDMEGAHVSTHDANPWREVLATEHQSRQHVLKQKLNSIKMENKELDKHVHALEDKLTSLFAVTEVLYVQEAELQQEVKDLRNERNSLRKCAGRTVYLLGKRLLWPANAVLRLVGIKKKPDTAKE